MPCQAGPSYGDSDHYQKIELDLVTRLLCEVLTKIETLQDQDDINPSYLISPETDKWLAKHKKADLERLAREEKQKKEKLKREQDAVKEEMKRKKREMLALEKKLRALEQED